MRKILEKINDFFASLLGAEPIPFIIVFFIYLLWGILQIFLYCWNDSRHVYYLQNLKDTITMLFG